MIENIQKLISDKAQQEVSNNGNIDNGLSGKVASETGTSLIDGLKSAVAGGNLGELGGLLNSSDQNSISSNPIVQNIINSLTSKLGSNVGLDSGTAGGFASSIIPQLISMITSKVKSGDFNLEEIIGSFTGGSGGTSPLDQNGDGKVGIDDAISAVKDGKLGDVLGGLFGKKEEKQ